MSKSILIDTTLCTACKGCQVACKQWHDLPAEHTQNNGSCQNPEDLSFFTYKLVRMTEEVIDNRLQWLFFPDQCRHCIDAPCMEAAYDPDAIYTDVHTGAVLFTRETRTLDADGIIDFCPYDIPRKATDGTLAKCDMCNDRVHNGLEPACVAVCPTGAMTFGDRNKILAYAARRLAKLRDTFPHAMLLDPEWVNVIYLVAFDPLLYSDYAVAKVHNRGRISRSMAIRKMITTFGKMICRAV
jgi:formate dehydrogenase iron-sulfur subunit